MLLIIKGESLMKVQFLMLITTYVAMGCMGRNFDTPENPNSLSSDRNLVDSCKAIDRDLLQKEVDRFAAIKRHPSDKWFLYDIAPYQRACVVLLSELNGEILGSSMDVVVYDPMNKKLLTVKDFLGSSIPKTLRAKIGQTHMGENSSGYFAEFTGDSVVDIFKIIMTQYPKSNSFSACVQYDRARTHGVDSYSPTGKLEWDPTPNRKWRVQNGEFDTQVASRNEVDDVYAGQLDEDFNGFMNGTLGCQEPKSARGHVGPWGGFVDQVFLDGKWTSVKYSSAYFDIRAPVVQNGPKFNYELRFTQGANFSSCYAFIENHPQIKEKAIMKSGVPGREEPIAVDVLISLPIDSLLKQIKAMPNCFDLTTKL